MAPSAAAGTALLLFLAVAVGGTEAAKCAFRAAGALCPSAADCCSIYGWCGIGPRFCGPGKCLSGPCEGDPLDAPPGCDGLCNATSLDGKPSRAQCRSGLLISDIQAPKQLGGACNSTQAASAMAGLCLGQRLCWLSGEDLCPAGPPQSFDFEYSCGDPAMPPAALPTPSPIVAPQIAARPAVRTASAVERKRALARCPRGQVIGAVPSVFYGKHSARCSASSSYRVVAASCMGKALCSPLATDAAFGGDPCPRVKPKVLWFQYRCIPQSQYNKGFRGVGATEGTRATVRCPAGQVITAIQGAFYGKVSRGCSAGNSYRLVARRCLGRRTCWVRASNIQFGVNPCPAIKPKYLFFQYKCERRGPVRRPQPTGPTAVAAEGKRAVASCPAGQIIKSVSDASYGKQSAGCAARTSYRVVAASCLGKARCSLMANDLVFGGDPCPRVKPKVLFFRYSCGAPPPPRPKPVPPSGGGNMGDGQRSLLWGENGERWRPTGRIPDWSYAGYMANDRHIPTYPVRVNVKDFGAVGNGVADDTDAVIKAIERASELAQLMTTEPCGSHGSRRCMLPHKGFQNEGRDGVAVLLPAGTYRITKMVEIYQSNVVLRGEGPRRTILYFPKGLQHVYGNQMAWAYMGGFLVLHGRNYDSTDTVFKLADITAGVTKGQTRVQVSTTSGIQVGQWVRIFARSPSRVAIRRGLLQGQATARPDEAELRETSASANGSVSLTSVDPAPAPPPPSALLPGNSSTAPLLAANPSPPPRPAYLPLPAAFVEGRRDAQAMGLDREEHLDPGQGVTAAAGDGTLDAYLYGENLASSATPYSGERIRFASRVRRMGSGWVELERPLPYDVRLGWQPALYSFATPLQHSGFEGFTVDFQWDVYPQHMKAYGYNAFWLYGAANSWVRNVEIINADTGAEAQNSDFITMRDLTFNITAPRGNKYTQNCDGHHGAWSAGSSNVHIANFNFHSRFIHDLTLDVFSQECVYNNGRGKDMSLDMHRSAIHNNLWSNIDVGLGTRPFSSSGQTVRGAHAAANNTWWNIYSSAGAVLHLPDCDFGPLLNFVGQYAPPQDCVQPGKCIKDGGVDTRTPLPAYCASMLWRVEQNQNKAGQRIPLFAPRDLFGEMVATRRQRLRL